MTTTDIDTVHDSDITLLPPKQRASSTAIAMLQEHHDLMAMAFDLAEKMCATKFVPTRFFRKPEEATAAMLYGMELGLNPIQSLQRVIPIHGMPSLEARTMVALVQAKGYKVKTRAQSDDAVTVWGRDLDGEEYETTWTMQRAKNAGYVPRPVSPDSECRPDVDEDWVTVTKVWDGKSKTSVVGNMKYITDPQAMLKAKAQAEVCREIAPEVLLGIGYSREDLESENWGEDTAPRTVQSTRGEPLTVDEVIGDDAAAAPSSGLGDKIKPATEPQRAPEPEPENAPAEPDPEEKPTRTRRTKAKAKTEPEAPAEAPAEPAPTAEATTTDQAPAAPVEEPAAPEPKPKTAMRKAVENRLFGLFNGIPALIGDPAKITREERIAIYKDVLGRDDITSTEDLDNVEVAKVSDELFKMGQEGSTLVDLINEVRNAIAIAEAAGSQ